MFKEKMMPKLEDENSDVETENKEKINESENKNSESENISGHGIDKFFSKSLDSLGLENEEKESILNQIEINENGFLVNVRKQGESIEIECGLKGIWPHGSKKIYKFDKQADDKWILSGSEEMMT